MTKYSFQVIESAIPGFSGTSDVILAASLSKAIEKWSRKHSLEAPAYWDEPSFERWIELNFKNKTGILRCKIIW